MITLTLVAVLQMNMKTSNTSLEEATLIETALTTCLGYWLFLGGSILSMAYLCSTYINTVQVGVNIPIQHKFLYFQIRRFQWLAMVYRVM